MKRLQITTLICFSLTMASCLLPNPNNAPENTLYEEEAYFDNDENDSDLYGQERQENTHNKTTSNVKTNIDPSHQQQSNFRGHNIYNQQTGMLFSVVPFPESWSKIENNKEFTFKGPNNIKVSGTFGQNFFYGSNYGGQNVPPMNLQQIIDQYFMPVAKQTNRTLLTTYELPKVAENNRNYLNSLWEYAPSQKTTKAYGLEWKDTDNVKYITVMVINDNRSQLGSYWNFFAQYLEAPSSHFDTAKKQYIYGLENTWYNPDQILAHNQNEMQKAGVRNAQHQQRMAAIKQRGQAILDIGKTYSEISDISHAGYLNRSNMNSHGHSKTISGINETTTIANHNTGEHYSVPMGNNHYWVANDGTYFGTDNANFNPNVNNQMNNKDWTKFEIEQ